jgi:hypothetical protein
LLPNCPRSIMRPSSTNTPQIPALDSGVDTVDVATDERRVAKWVEPQVAVTVSCPAVSVDGLIETENAPCPFAAVVAMTCPPTVTTTSCPAPHPAPATVVASPGTTVPWLNVNFVGCVLFVVAGLVDVAWTGDTMSG